VPCRRDRNTEGERRALGVDGLKRDSPVQTNKKAKASSMKSVRLGCLIVGAALAGAFVLLTASYVYVSSDSFAASGWRSKFAAQLQSRGEVGVAELVNFNWEKIYFILPYETRR
jgi:hypothetical protein